MYKFFKKEKPDIVHVHTPIAAVLGRIAAKLARVPNIIYTAHGFYFHDNMKPYLYRVFFSIEKYIGRFFTDYIFTQSQEDKETASRSKFLKDNNKIICISNGVDVNGKFNSDNISKDEIEKLYDEFGIKPDDKIVSFIGRVVREKGIIELMEAFMKINNEKVKLLIIGDVFEGERDLETIKEIQKYKSNKNIIFTGIRDDIPSLLYISDIFCLPSYREGMPRSIIEAMAMECAVIATNIRGCREEVIPNETGYLVPVKSIEPIYDKIEFLLNNEDILECMKKKGRERAKLLYNEKRVVETQIKIYDSLLEEN